MIFRENKCLVIQNLEHQRDTDHTWLSPCYGYIIVLVNSQLSGGHLARSEAPVLFELGGGDIKCKICRAGEAGGVTDDKFADFSLGKPVQ